MNWGDGDVRGWDSGGGYGGGGGGAGVDWDVAGVGVGVVGGMGRTGGIGGALE